MMRKGISLSQMDISDFEHRIQLRIKQCLQVAEQNSGIALEVPEIDLSLKGYQAGQAFPAKWLLRFNAEMAEQDQEKFIHEVTAHEVAHLVTYKIWKTLDHGADFCKVMSWFNVKAKRCHNFAAEPSRKIRRFEYRCSCSSHQLSSIRHNRIQRGNTYQCRFCKETLLPFFEQNH